MIGHDTDLRSSGIAIPGKRHYPPAGSMALMRTHQLLSGAAISSRSIAGIPLQKMVASLP